MEEEKSSEVLDFLTKEMNMSCLWFVSQLMAIQECILQHHIYFINQYSILEIYIHISYIRYFTARQDRFAICQN